MHYLCFTEKEFLVLLSGIEVKKIVCFDLEKEEVVTQKQYNEAVFSLCKRGILLSGKQGNDLYLNEQYKPMFHVMKNAVCMFQFESSDKTIPEYCIYSDNTNYVVATVGTRKDEYIKLGFIRREDFMTFFEEMDFFSNERMCMPLFLECTRIEDELKKEWKTRSFISQDRFKSLSTLKFLITIKSMKDKELENIAIVWQEDSDKIVVSSNEGNEIILYSEEKIMGLLIEKIGGRYDIS